MRKISGRARRASSGAACAALLILFGAGVLWFFLPVVVYGVLNIGNLTGLAISLAGFCAVFFRRRLKPLLGKLTRRGWQKALAAVLCAALALLAGAAVFLTARMAAAADLTPVGDETVVVLGCQVRGTQPSLMLRGRIEAARRYLEVHPEASCVLSGGQGEDEDISEAQCMFYALTEAGIAPERLYLEDRSTSTAENIAFSARVIEENGLSPAMCIVTNEFHQYRASLIARAYTEDPRTVSAASPVILLATYVVREYYALAALLILK